MRRYFLAMCLLVSACAPPSSDQWHQFAINYAMIHQAESRQPPTPQPLVVTRCMHTLNGVTCLSQ